MPEQGGTAESAAAVEKNSKACGGVQPTIGSGRQAWAQKFRACGIETPELDARILVGHALGLDHAALAAANTRPISARDDEAIAALGQRRLAREPVARILGFKEFWSLRLRVDAHTLLPRPETETVVAAALDALDGADARSHPIRIADLGTGSGAILLAILSELPNAVGIGTDISFAALLIARDNAERLGLPRARFVVCDMAAALRGPFDLIVANPPYIRTSQIETLSPEVRDFDPRGALDGGIDGLDHYRSIAAIAPDLLIPGGTLVVELGLDQGRPVGALFARAGLALQPPQPDLSGVPRALVARKMA